MYLYTRRSIEVVGCSHQGIELPWILQLWMWTDIATTIPQRDFLTQQAILAKLPDKKHNLPFLYRVATLRKKKLIHIKTLKKYITFIC